MRQLKQNIFEVGVIDWDRRMFDELIPLPDGTSYNAYLIKGSEKTALLDTVDPTKWEIFVGHLLNSGIERIDYIVAHHGEQDHSGCISDVLAIYPDAKIVANQKCRNLLIDHLEVEDDQFLTIEDGQTLSLGDKTMKFIDIPWVHWPETFGTYLIEDKIFFPCDFFGSHLATSNLFVQDPPLVYEAAKRYYAEIMMPFRGPIKRNLDKMKDLDIEMIAPSHGPVYDKPQFILDAYKDWISDEVKNEVIVAYISMHGSTRKMVECFVELLAAKGVKVYQFDLNTVDIGKLAIRLVDAATVVLASPTVLTQAHPKVAYAALLTNLLRPKTKFASIIGSYGWGGKMVEQLTGLMDRLKVELIEPAIAKGYPDRGEFEALDRLAEAIFNKHNELGIV